MKKPNPPVKLAISIIKSGEHEGYNLVEADAYYKLVQELKWVVQKGKHIDPVVVNRFRNVLKELGEI